MPDFEALVRHQQHTRKPSNDCLKLVEKQPFFAQTPITDGQNLSTLFFGFVGGLSGSIIGIGLILYLSSKELIDFKMLF